MHLVLHEFIRLVTISPSQRFGRKTSPQGAMQVKEVKTEARKCFALSMNLSQARLNTKPLYAVGSICSCQHTTIIALQSNAAVVAGCSSRRFESYRESLLTLRYKTFVERTQLNDGWKGQCGRNGGGNI